MLEASFDHFKPNVTGCEMSIQYILIINHGFKKLNMFKLMMVDFTMETIQALLTR